MRFFVLIQLLWFVSVPGYSQLLMNQDGEAFTEKPFFNKDIVRINRIKTIEGNYSTKKPGEIVRETNDWFRYKFDENGQLIETLDVRTTNRKKDSVLHQYAYDAKGLIIEHRKSENEGFTTVKYTYDSLNQLETERTYREIYSYKLQKVIESNLVNVEYFQYVHREDETEQIRFNNYRLPYLDVVSHFNQFGYLTEKTTHFRVSSIEHKTKYTYNDHGLLSSKAFYNEQDELADEEWKYSYDSYGNLIQVHFFRYGEFQKDLQVVFDNKTHLLGATIQREVATDFMLILRFKKYSYFP